MIKKTAIIHAVPVAFASDEVSSWSADGLVIEDCLIVYQPKHRYDYINIVFRIRREGDKAYILKSEYGISPRISYTDVLCEAKKLGKPLGKIIEDDKELEAEKRY